MNVDLELSSTISKMKEVEFKAAKIRSRYKKGVSCAPKKVQDRYYNLVNLWTELNKKKTMFSNIKKLTEEQ